MDNYGEFTVNIVRLNQELEIALGVWVDETGFTYQSINDNPASFAKAMWGLFDQSKQGYEAMQQNYRPEDIESRLGNLNSKLAALV